MMSTSVNRQRGFTLIELMIVVAIIAIIAAIAVPNLLRSRIQANEASAIGGLKTIVGAEFAYYSDHHEYTDDWDVLHGADPPYLVESQREEKSGYDFTLTAGDADFQVTAAPTVPNRTGVRYYFVDSSGVVRYNEGGDADADSPPIE